MTHPTTQPPNYPSTIDIILSVIDNYGDIGFACELIAAWRREIGSDTTFVIWTNQVSQVTSFVSKNQHLLGKVEIQRKGDFWKARLSDIALALFHADIPEIEYFTKGALVLRIDYLSFDKTWLVHHLHEHIASTSDRRIIEVIPSPIPESAWLLYPYDTSITRDILANTYNLDRDKNWIIVFAYPSTLQDILTFDNIDNHTQVLVFGIEREDMTFLQSTKARLRAVGPWNDGDMIWIPWVDIATWHALVDESAWTLVRGEVSAVASIMRGKLAFWDMYKEIGWLNHEQSKDYLNMSSTDSAYRDIHERLNWQKTWWIYWSELEQYIQKNSIPQMYGRERTKNLITEIKKCIDSHEFSI
jgi:hypothetical protein